MGGVGIDVVGAEAETEAEAGGVEEDIIVLYYRSMGGRDEKLSCYIIPPRMSTDEERTSRGKREVGNRQRGGKVLGRGFKGKTMGTSCSFRDADTLCAVFAALVSDVRRRGGVDGIDGLSVHLDLLPRRVGRQRIAPSMLRATLRGEDAVRCLRELPKAPGTTKFIAKVFDGVRPSEAYAREIASTRLLTEVYGKDTPRFTTIRGIPFNIQGQDREVIGVTVFTTRDEDDDDDDSSPPAALSVALSGRCNKDVDRLLPLTDEGVWRLAVDVLESLDRLHAHGMVHTDVKADNIIYCADEQRFKLVDWELSCTIDSLRMKRDRRSFHKPPTSPFAWYAWGAEKNVARSAFLVYWYARRGRRLMSNATLRRELWNAGSSFVRWASSPAVTEETRSALFERHATSIDLFDFGFVLIQAVSMPMKRRSSDNISDDTRRVMMELGRRLYTMDDESSPSSKTREALRWIQEEEESRRRT